MTTLVKAMNEATDNLLHNIMIECAKLREKVADAEIFNTIVFMASLNLLKAAFEIDQELKFGNEEVMRGRISKELFPEYNQLLESLEFARKELVQHIDAHNDGNPVFYALSKIEAAIAAAKGE